MASTDPLLPQPPDQDIPEPVMEWAEPLSPEAAAARLRELAAWGVDLSLVRANLELTPTERLRRMIEFLAVGESLHQSYIQAIGNSQREAHG